MSILNVNQIQPVGGGNTITVSASDVSASGATITASSFVGNVTGNLTGNVTGNLTGNVTGNLTGNVTGNVTSSSTSTFSSGLNVTGGNVGIGTDSAEALLDVEGIGQFGNNPLTDTGIQLNGSVGRIRVGRSGNVFEARNGSDSTIKASISGSTGGANFLGSVGIGTDSPVSGVKLHLQDTSACRIQLSTDNTGHTSSDGARLMIDSSNNFEILNRENASIEFFTNNTQRWSINSTGNLVAASSGLGIDFSAASGSAAGSTSAVLDDYEEGTWTPTTTQFAGYTSNGRYTKIGRIVYIEGVITRNTTTAPNAVNLQAQSLPFTVNNISSVVSGNYWLDEGGPSTNQGDSVGSAYFIGSSTNVLFVRPTDPSNQTNARYVQADEVTNSRGISFYGWYRV